MGVTFGLTGAALGLWFGTFGSTASRETLVVMRPIAGVFVVASLLAPAIGFAMQSRRTS